jgi:hypothetical protein
LKTFLCAISITAAAFGYLAVIDTTINVSCEGLSFATFMLWSALAWITTITTWKQSGEAGVPLMYSIGATITMCILMWKGKTAWSSNDTIVAILVVICVVVWMVKGDRLALVASVMAATIAVIPFMLLTWKNPSLSPIVANTSFLIANIFGFISAEKWTLQDRLYLGVNIGVCGLLVLPYWLQ